MPIPETAKQRRWSFAAEARGELPPGTAKRWAEETKAYEARRKPRRRKRFCCSACAKGKRCVKRARRCLIGDR